MIENPELFEKYLSDNYPDLYKKVEWKFIYSPSTSRIGFLNVNNPTDNEEDAVEFERIIEHTVVDSHSTLPLNPLVSRRGFHNRQGAAPTCKTP